MNPVLKILTDYPRDDLAHDEVHQALVTACLKHGVAHANLDVGSIPGMDTVTAGFKTAQLALNSNIGFGHVFHTNCAPRKNIVTAKSQGEKIVLGMTKTGVCVLMVNAGYALTPFRAAAEAGDIAFYQTSVPDAGSQFRSRDFFPDALAELAAHLAKQTPVDDVTAALKGLSYLGAPMDIDAIPTLPKGTVFYTDNFGNIKLNIHHTELRAQYDAGEILAVRINDTVCDAVVGEAGFSQGEGMLALTSGSSGWPVAGDKNFFTEIFLRGGSARERFSSAQAGDSVLMLRENDLKQVVDILRGIDRAAADRLDLHDMSEARVIKLLSRAELINDCCDTTALTQSLKDGTVAKKVSAL